METGFARASSKQRPLIQRAKQQESILPSCWRWEASDINVVGMMTTLSALSLACKSYRIEPVVRAKITGLARLQSLFGNSRRELILYISPFLEAASIPWLIDPFCISRNVILRPQDSFPAPNIASPHCLEQASGLDKAGPPFPLHAVSERKLWPLMFQCSSLCLEIATVKCSIFCGSE